MAAASVISIIFSVRLLCLSTALIFVPFCAIPLNFTATVDAILVGLGASSLWNLFLMINILFLNIAVSWPCYLLGDALVFPGMTGCFIVISIVDGLQQTPQSSPSNKDNIVALCLLGTVGFLHVTAFTLSMFYGLDTRQKKRSNLQNSIRLTGEPFGRTNRPQRSPNKWPKFTGPVAIQKPMPSHVVIATDSAPTATGSQSIHQGNRTSEESLPAYAIVDMEPLPPYPLDSSTAALVTREAT